MLVLGIYHYGVVEGARRTLVLDRLGNRIVREKHSVVPEILGPRRIVERGDLEFQSLEIAVVVLEKLVYSPSLQVTDQSQDIVEVRTINELVHGYDRLVQADEVVPLLGRLHGPINELSSLGSLSHTRSISQEVDVVLIHDSFDVLRLYLFLLVVHEEIILDRVHETNDDVYELVVDIRALEVPWLLSQVVLVVLVLAVTEILEVLEENQQQLQVDFPLLVVLLLDFS